MPATSAIYSGRGYVAIYNADGTETKVGSLNSFTLAPDARPVIDVPDVFEQDRSEALVGIKGYKTFTCSGIYSPKNDAGQVAIRNAYHDETEIQMRFYLEPEIYIGNKGNNEENYCRITSVDAIDTSAEGFASWSIEGLIIGETEENDVS